MKKLSLLPIVIFALAVSCEKPMSEADRNAQVEREVQQRLAAERQSADQARLAQQQADLEARERALAEKQAAAVAPIAAHTAAPIAREESRTTTSSSDRRGARSYDTFYRKLEPYGAWREAGDYGYVWQPRAAQSRNWRPYTDGRWAYTDAGWTWVSSEPFGWATYHYGRWTRLRGVGWVWVPGEEWAPAWVSWRTSNQHVGWAPLPPEARFEHRTGIKKWADSYYDIGADEYVFIPNEDIGAENIERSVISVEQNVTIVNETVNVTNITYNNTTIVNEGPNYDELRGRSHRPVERLRLQREYDIDQDQTPQTAVQGNVLTIMTPLFSARATQRPRNVGAPIPQAVVERNWATNANQPDAQRARAKMKAEATAPADAPPKTIEKPTVLEGTPAPAPQATVAVTPPPVATPMATPTPIVSSTPLPTPKPTATPLPIATVTPSPLATATPTPMATPTPKPRVTPTPASTATPDPTATPTPAATATPTPPVKIAPTPMGIATPTPIPAATRKPMPLSTPIPVPSRGITDPPERDGDPSSDSGEGVDGRKGRPPLGPGGVQRGARDEARDARTRGAISRMGGAKPTPPPVAPLAPKPGLPPMPAPPVPSRAVTPAPAVAPVAPSEITEPVEAAPNLKGAGRRPGPALPLPPPGPKMEPPVVPATPTPTPTPPAKTQTDGDNAENGKPNPTPKGADEP